MKVETKININGKDFVLRKFNTLPRGARIAFPEIDEDCSNIYVVLETYGSGLLASFSGIDDGIGQSICCFEDEENRYQMDSLVHVLFE